MDLSSVLFNKKIAGGGTPGPGPQPTGTIEITENGTYDVAQYAEADVQVTPTQVVYADEEFFSGDRGMSFSLIPAAVPTGIRDIVIKNLYYLDAALGSADDPTDYSYGWQNYVDSLVNGGLRNIYIEKIKPANHLGKSSKTADIVIALGQTRPYNLPINIIIQDTTKVATLSCYGTLDQGAFYVPDSLINDYKQNQEWANLVDRIYPLSSFTP